MLQVLMNVFEHPSFLFLHESLESTFIRSCRNLSKLTLGLLFQLCILLFWCLIHFIIFDHLFSLSLSSSLLLMYLSNEPYANCKEGSRCHRHARSSCSFFVNTFTFSMIYLLKLRCFYYSNIYFLCLVNDFNAFSNPASQ